jgi:hypothetical protein
MNKISLYFLLILIYLGLSKSFAPSEQATSYIANEHTLQHSFPNSPVSVILTDAFKTGFIIHTYFQRYKVIHVFKPPEDIYFRTSETFWTKHLEHMGMSILRRDEKLEEATTTPLPPGFLFIGDPAYGSWEYKSSGEKAWQFHNAYKKFPKLLGWNDFLATEDFYKSGLLYLKNDRAYFGLDQEFGSEGTITQEVYGWTPPSERSFRGTLKGFWPYIKQSLSFETASKKTDSSVKNIENASSRTSPKKSKESIPLKYIKPQLGERPPKNQNKNQNDQSLFPTLPLSEKVDE